MDSDKKFVAVQLGSNLRRLRRRTGISQEALAGRCALHRTEVGMLERGERTPRIDTLIKLATCLDVFPRELLAGIKWNAETRDFAIEKSTARTVGSLFSFAGEAGERVSSPDEPSGVEQAIELGLLLRMVHLLPSNLTGSMWIYEMAGRPGRQSEIEATERALGNLLRNGLAYEDDELIVPSEGAMDFLGLSA